MIERPKAHHDDEDGLELGDDEQIEGMEAPAASEKTPRLVRLNKVLAERGVGPRRRCDELISSGGVEVDGIPVTELGTKIDPERARVTVNGVEVKAPPRVVYALHKPKGVVCTSATEERRIRAVDLVRDPAAARLFCVGRLDTDSEGLLLLTNDGDLANRISHPRYQVSKTYFVKVHGRVSDEALRKAGEGVWLAEGRTAGLRVVVRKRLSNATVLLVTVREGMNREIRRVFAKLGFAVQALKRVAIGPVSLRGLHEGRYRRLDPSEVRTLLEASVETSAKPLPKKGRVRRPFGGRPGGEATEKPDRKPHRPGGFPKRPSNTSKFSPKRKNRRP
ncbi:MAG: rRNA pseudouridine synthase [Planctomycetes bacterium]|nr:rRNA pseudouridine synthase [Planctomycetota bacterium]